MRSTLIEPTTHFSSLKHGYSYQIHVHCIKTGVVIVVNGRIKPAATIVFHNFWSFTQLQLLADYGQGGVWDGDLAEISEKGYRQVVPLWPCL